MNLPQQALASRNVKMMQEIRQQNQIVAGAKVSLKGATRNGPEAICHAGLLSVFRRDFQNVGPVQRHNLRLRILLGNGNPEQPVPCGNVQHFPFSARMRTYQFRDRLRRSCRHRRH